MLSSFDKKKAATCHPYDAPVMGDDFCIDSCLLTFVPQCKGPALCMIKQDGANIDFSDPQVLPPLPLVACLDSLLYTWLILHTKKGAGPCQENEEVDVGVADHVDVV